MTQLIIKQHSPRRTLMIVGLVIAVITTVVAAYELGQRRAGFNRFEAGAAEGELQQSLSSARAEIDDQAARIAQLEASAKVDREAYARVEDELLELQTRISQQEEDLAFYRGIVSPADGANGLRVQQIEVRQGAGPLDWNLRFVLAQALQNDNAITGRLELSFVGRQNGRSETLSSSQIGGGARLDFSFRYFQDIRTDVSLPLGFEPEQIVVRLRPRGRGRDAIESSFDWRVATG